MNMAAIAQEHCQSFQDQGTFSLEEGKRISAVVIQVSQAAERLVADVTEVSIRASSV